MHCSGHEIKCTATELTCTDFITNFNVQPARRRDSGIGGKRLEEVLHRFQHCDAQMSIVVIDVELPFQLTLHFDPL